jgi:hypothetical protein
MEENKTMKAKDNTESNNVTDEINKAKNKINNTLMELLKKNDSYIIECALISLAFDKIEQINNGEQTFYFRDIIEQIAKRIEKMDIGIIIVFNQSKENLNDEKKRNR